MDEHRQETPYFESVQNTPQYVSAPPKPSKGHGQGIIIAVTIILSIIMVIATAIGVCTFRNYMIKTIIGKPEQADNAQDDTETVPFENSLPQPDEEAGEQRQDDELEEWERQLTCYGEEDNPFLTDSYVSHMGTNHLNHERTDFIDQSYNTICDSISQNVPYTIERKYYTYASQESDVQIHISCVSLNGMLPNLDALNQAIYDKTMFLAKVYLENYQSYASTQGINIMVDSYVTYNDDSKLSIVLDEYYIIEQDVNIDLYCINADLDSGMILNNAKIINYNESFAEEFREKSARQNGADTALNDMDVVDILDLLKDEYNNIIFYTPIGMELGINYVMNGNSGWITVSYPDYQNYINNL